MQTTLAASGARANGPRWRRWLQTALLVAPALGLAVLGWRHPFITDDGFIFFRVVEQITAGHGPVFSSGQRVEAFTSPLWLAVLTVFDVATPFQLEWIAVVSGVAFTGVGLGLSCFGAAKLLRDPIRHDVFVPVGALVPLVIAPMWYFATSGLETGLVFGWIGASMWILAGWARRDDGVRAWEAVVLGVGWLVRPDLLPLSIAFAGALLFASWSTDGWRDRGRVVAVMFALPFLYQVFRMGYYGALVPNTAIAKEATLSRWDAGWRYVTDLGGAYWLWIPILALVVGSYLPLVVRFHRSGATRELAVVAA